MTYSWQAAVLALTLASTPMGAAGAVGAGAIAGLPRAQGGSFAVPAIRLPPVRPKPPAPASRASDPATKGTKKSPARERREPPTTRRDRARAAAQGPWITPLPGAQLLRPVDPPAQRWLAGHRGVDLSATQGTLVRAPQNGVVAYVGVIAGRAVVSIDHTGGLRSTYEPVVADLRVGAKVAKGSPFGRVDTAAGHCGDQACLHWGLKRGKVYLDPLSLLKVQSPVLLPLT